MEGEITSYIGDGNGLLDEDYDFCNCYDATEGETCIICGGFCRVTMPNGAKKVFNHELSGVLVEKALLEIMFAYWHRPIWSSYVRHLFELTDDSDVIIAGESVRETFLGLVCGVGLGLGHITCYIKYNVWCEGCYTAMKVVRYTLEEHSLFQRDETHDFLYSLQ